MKLRKLLSVTLALLLVVSLLPVSVLAVDNSTDGETIKGPIDANTGSNVTVAEGGSVGTNSGEIITNNGTIDTNKGTVGSYVNPDKKEPDTSTGNQKDGDITGNTGTVVVNNGDILVNGAEAQEGHYGPDIDWTTLNENATVELNTGNITKNLGQVTQNGKGGYIGENDGNIGANLEGAEVEYNDGTIGENSGTVEINDGNVNNLAGGKVKANYGYVENEAGGKVKENYGYVENEAGGLLYDMIVTENPEYEEYDKRYSPTYQKFTGKEGTYVGTIVEQGYIETTDETTGEKQSEGFEEGGIVIVLKQAILDTVLNLKEVGKMFKKDGYEVIGYYTDAVAERALSDDDAVEEESPVEYETQYTVKEGTPWLTLIWKAITKPSGGSDGGAEPTSSGNTGRKNPPILSSLSADKVSVGALIRCGKVIFKIIEVNDDSIRVATVDTLSQRNQEDMMGYLKQYLSADQIAKFIGQPELLDADEIAQFFKDNKAHIAFYAAKDLFEA